MTDKPKIQLAIFDADDMIWHAYGPWAACMGPAMDDLVEYLGVDPEKLRHAIQNDAIGQHRFNDYGGLSHFLSTNGLIPRVNDPQEQYERDIIRRNIRSRFFEDWRKLTKFYDGTIETITKLKAAGTRVAIWTDSDAPTIIRRFDSACKNAGMTPEDAIGFVKKFDAIYAMPSAECDSRLLWNIDTNIIHAIKKRMVISSDPKGWKPATPEPVATPRGQAILADFNIAPEHALMIGDSYKDVFAAIQAGMHGAWFKHGANQTPETVEMLTRVASPRYKYGIDAIQEQLDTHLPHRGYIVIENDIAELENYFTFAPAERGYHHSLLSQQCHIPLALVHPDQVGARLHKELNAQFGIATHFGEVIPVIAPQDQDDMAGPEISGLPQEPLPA
jgi:FMN phosphatase YigB (HAD superfamily)